jgi:hypothetical protein
MSTTYIKLSIPEAQVPVRIEVSRAQIRGLHKLASVILPKSQDLPDFSEIGPEELINGMIDYMYPDDRGAILVLLKGFAIMPRFLIRLIMHIIIGGARWKGAAGAVFRMLQIALKGLVFTLYYSDFTENKEIHGKLGYDAKIVWK